MNNTYDQIDILNSPVVDAMKSKFTDCMSKHITLPSISRILLDYRRSFGCTQKTLSELLQIPKRTIENWETGKSTPPPYVTRLIWFALAFHAFTNPSI